MGFDKDGHAIPDQPETTTTNPAYGLQFADNAPPPSVTHVKSQLQKKRKRSMSIKTNIYDVVKPLTFSQNFCLHFGHLKLVGRNMHI